MPKTRVVRPQRSASAQPTIAELSKSIRKSIVDGEYAPNQRLIETDLSSSLGASRAAIRAALLELASEGLIDRMPNRGSRVRAISVADAIKILEVRIGIEGLCAAKAAESVTDDEIRELRQLREDILDSVRSGNLVEYSRLHQLLDRRIREISNHSVAVEILERLQAQSVRHQFKLSFQPGRAAVSAPEHAAIIDAITSRDPEAAKEATKIHLLGVIDALQAS